MFKKELLATYLKTAVIATVIYSIPMIFFIKSANYNNSYWLFIGNFLFLAVVAWYVWSLNKSRGENASSQTMRIRGHIVTLFGILLSCIVATIALTIFIPNIFSSEQTDKILENAPAQTGTGETNGLVFILYMCTVIGNFCGGSIASILIPITARKNQTKDNKSDELNN